MRSELNQLTFDNVREVEKLYLLAEEGDKVVEADLATLSNAVVVVFSEKKDVLVSSYQANEIFLNQLRQKYNISVVIAFVSLSDPEGSLIAINKKAARIEKVRGEVLIGHGVDRSINLGSHLDVESFLDAFLDFEKKSDPIFVAFVACKTGQILAKEVSREYNNITIFAPTVAIELNDVILHEGEFYFGKEGEDLVVSENVRKVLNSSTAKYKAARKISMPPTTELSQKVLDSDNEDQVLKDIPKYKKEAFFEADAINLTPFHYAISKGYVRVLQAMLDQLGETKDQKLLLNKPGLKGFTPLMMAAQVNNFQVIDFLLSQRCIELKKRDEYGKTILHWAVKLRNLPLVQRLKDEGLDLEVKDSYGDTALIYSVYAEDLESTEMLIRLGASVNAQNEKGITIFMMAMFMKRSDIIIDLLVSLDEQRLFTIDPTLVDIDGDTALHYAASRGHFKAVKMLISKGARVDAKNKDGKIPIQLAISEGHDAIADLIDFSQVA